MMMGMEQPHIFVERGVSGGKPFNERPQGAQLLAALQAGDVAITPKLDRIFRSARDALNALDDFKRRQVSLHIIDLGGDVTGNGISKLVFTILSAVAESERDRIRENVRGVKADQRKRGRYLGGTAPFGYRVSGSGQLVADKDQQKAIKRMRSMHRSGRSLRAIADDMKERGFQISHVGVKRLVMHDPRYTGL
jgi:DNA invertase Pin-like site-specific DNA recombinase